jgi:streptomycin 6-kinase
LQRGKLSSQNKDMDVTIPIRLAASCRKSPERAQWLAKLPDNISSLQSRWSLQIGPPFDSVDVSCAWVAPVTLPDRGSAILKIGMPHLEGEHEIDGLRFWNAGPMVRLLEADDDLGAMLMERCEPGTTLRTLPEPEQDIVIARILRRLWQMPSSPHPFRPLSVMTEHWVSETLAQAGQWSDPGLVSEGLRLLRELPETAAAQMLLATDLHAGNVLRAQREPWLAIDPKPFVGDPAFDATQHLVNCTERLCANPGGTIRRRAGLLEVDHQRVRLWMFARAAAEPRDNWKSGPWLDLARRIAPR